MDGKGKLIKKDFTEANVNNDTLKILFIRT